MRISDLGVVILRRPLNSGTSGAFLVTLSIMLHADVVELSKRAELYTPINFLHSLSSSAPNSPHMVVANATIEDKGPVLQRVLSSRAVWIGCSSSLISVMR